MSLAALALCCAATLAADPPPRFGLADAERPSGAWEASLGTSAAEWNARQSLADVARIGDPSVAPAYVGTLSRMGEHSQAAWIAAWGAARGAPTPALHPLILDARDRAKTWWSLNGLADLPDPAPQPSTVKTAHKAVGTWLTRGLSLRTRAQRAIAFYGGPWGPTRGTITRIDAALAAGDLEDHLATQLVAIPAPPDHPTPVDWTLWTHHLGALLQDARTQRCQAALHEIESTRAPPRKDDGTTSDLRAQVFGPPMAALRACVDQGTAAAHTLRQRVAAPLAARAQICGGSASCTAVGARALGAGKPKGMVEGRHHLVTACAAGQPIACKHLAGMELDAKGGPKDPAAATLHYEAACVEGEGYACYRAGILAELAVPRDMGSAVLLHARACELEEPFGCSRLAELWEGGFKVGHGSTRPAGPVAVEPDAERARSARMRACTLQKKPNCDEPG